MSGPASKPRGKLHWSAALVPAGLLLLAEAVVDSSRFPSESIAAPSAAAVAGLAAFTDGSLLRATLQTLAAAFAGLGLGGGIGLASGLLLGMLPVLDRLMDVTVEALHPIPAVALIPIALLVYGFGYRMEIAVVAFACIWPVLVLTRAAILGIEPRLLEVGRALRFGFVHRITKIVLPAALPRIFVAFRLAAGVALIVAVTCEITANPIGLGYGMMTAEQSLQPALMLAFLAWIGVVGWGVNLALMNLQSRLFGRANVPDAGR